MKISRSHNLINNIGIITFKQKEMRGGAHVKAATRRKVSLIAKNYVLPTKEVRTILTNQMRRNQSTPKKTTNTSKGVAKVKEYNRIELKGTEQIRRQLREGEKAWIRTR